MAEAETPRAQPELIRLRPSPRRAGGSSIGVLPPRLGRGFSMTICVLGLVGYGFGALLGVLGRPLWAPILIHGVLLLMWAVLVLGQKDWRTPLRSLGLSGFCLFEFVRGCLVPLLVVTLGQDVGGRGLGGWIGAGKVLYVGNGFFALAGLGAWLANVVRPVGSPPVDSVSVSDAASSLNASASQSLNGGHQRPIMRGFWRGSAWLCVLGVVGLLVRFPNLSGVIEFLSGSEDYLRLHPLDGTPGFLSSISRPLLPIGMIGLFLRGRISPVRLLTYLPASGVAAVLCWGSFGLNRATIILPLGALAVAIASRRRARTPFPILAVGVLVLVFVFVWVGDVRAVANADRSGYVSERGVVEGLLSDVMVYGQSPLQSAPIMELPAQSEMFGPSSLLDSILSPMPGVPVAIRDGSGARLYNEVFYGDTLSHDQVFPSWLEVWVSLGVIALVGWAFLVVWVLGRAGDRLLAADAFISRYTVVLLALIFMQAGTSSVTVLVQETLYLGGAPLLVSGLLGRERARVLPVRATHPGGLRSVRGA